MRAGRTPRRSPSMPVRSPPCRASSAMCTPRSAASTSSSTAPGVNIRKPADEITEEDWNGLFEINVRAMFFACQEAARVMRAQGGGCILNVGSGSDLLTVSNIAPYCHQQGRRPAADALARCRVGVRRHPRQLPRAGPRAHRDDRGRVRRPRQARRARQGDSARPRERAGRPRRGVRSCSCPTPARTSPDRR